jgi:hypothetical protein
LTRTLPHVGVVQERLEQAVAAEVAEGALGDRLGIDQLDGAPAPPALLGPAGQN